jgi:hypothetical protein
MALLSASACDKKSERVGQQTQSSQPSAAAGRVTAALGEYEKLRVSLANDQGAGLSQIADALAQASRAALPDAPIAQRAGLESIAQAAAVLAKTSATDLDAQRENFGRVSQSVIGLLVADPTLRPGWHIFHCPMTETYPKWVQPSSKLSNPYMGKKMPDCGRESDWKM